MHTLTAPSRPLLAALLLALAGSCAALVWAQAGAREGATSPPPADELWVELLDGEGRSRGEEAAALLEVRAGGEPAALADRGPVGEWRVVIYFDQLLAEPLAFRNATIQLGEQARELTALGEVEVVLGGEETRLALPPTRDADALSQALAWMRLREDAEDRQAAVRRAFRDELGLARDEGGEASAVELGPEEVRAGMAAALAEEAEVLRGQRERLLAWIGENTSPGPRVLLLVGSGFDAEPMAFYRGLLETSPWRSALDGPSPPEIRPTVAETAQALSAYGWLVLPYRPEVRGDALLDQAEAEAETQEGADKVDVVFQDGRMVDRTTIGLDPVKWLRQRRERQAAGTAAVLLRPDEPLRALAAASGGELIQGKLQLVDALHRLPQRRRIGYVGAVAGVALRSLEVALRPDAPRETETWVVRARRWEAGATPEAMSTVRARMILDGRLDEGELPVAAALRPGEPGEPVSLVIQLEDDAAGEGSDLRLTLAAAPDEGEPAISHRLVRAPSPTAGGQAMRELRVDLPPPPGDGLVLVLVEVLESGRWGGAFASLLADSDSWAADDLDSLLLPAPKAVHLLAPRQPLVMGPTLFETVISLGEVQRVEFLLDGEIQVVREAPPFRATLDLGPLPQPRRVDVVARGAGGRELGRDYLVVNEGSGVFGVRIVSPRPGAGEEPGERLLGPVEVEAEVEPRRGEGIHRVEFFWKESLVATRYAPPWRQRVVVPAEAPKGFFRVVAYLEDGSSSEDVLFVNSPGSSDRLQVNLMELYVVVTDRRGRPVTDQPRERFRVFEENERQEISTFGSARDLPLTVGLAIDSSASMFVKLPDVQFAAAEFIRGLASRRDRAFVVNFGDQPRLAKNTTSDLQEVVGALSALEPDGRTAIWKAIVYALVQLQGVPGKKALVVYTDGADEDPDFSFRTCLRFARKVGVPIYVILSNNEIRRTDGRGLNVRGFLQRLETLVSSVGGRIFMARVGEDLEEVYREIDEELRSQYLVGYYSRDAGGREWRNLRVEVGGTGLSARTIAGYYR